ncbi:MAG TPA: GtrA family protein [Pyrinomonadaceae bacterium]|nr:GtrA family protein [Pyrinomonadaceae bacterium]
MFRWIKFNAVGISGFALQTSVLFALTHKARPLGYLAATACAVELAILNNFIWHQRWTWKDRPSLSKAETLQRLAKFHVTNGALSIAGNLAFMTLFVGVLKIHIVVANITSVALCSIFNFLLADRIAFHRARKQETKPQITPITQT